MTARTKKGGTGTSKVMTALLPAGSQGGRVKGEQRKCDRLARPTASQSTSCQGFRYTGQVPGAWREQGRKKTRNKGDADVELNIRIIIPHMARLPVFNPEEYVAVFPRRPVKPFKRTAHWESCFASIVDWAG